MTYICLQRRASSTAAAHRPQASRVMLVAALLTVWLVAGCSTIPPSNVKSNARLTPTSNVTRDLGQLPEPKARIAVAVYGFRDQTGQFKPSPDSSYSTSVTQGAASMLVKALKDSGWFMPVEREGLQNLLTERKIVRAIESPTEKGKPLVNLPPLMPASMIIEGGVIAYESNVRTGGKGANYLGIGASTQYHVDQVTVIVRAIDIRDGQVLNTVSVTKTIYSYQFSANIYKFTSFQHLLQGETGFTTNEPAQLAVREAIELAVIHMTVQGVRDRFLDLKNDEDINAPIVQAYLTESMSNQNEDADTEGKPVRRRSLLADDLVPPVQPLVPSSAAKVAARARAAAAVGRDSQTQAQPRGEAAAAAGTDVIAAAKLGPTAAPAAKPGGAADDIFRQYWQH